jgi:hypothetical protein
MISGVIIQTTQNPASVRIARSISSTVRLDVDARTAHKTYAPPLWVRVLYRLAFQAPFPYEGNGHALEAAQHRRRIAGLLTEYWFGRNLVSPTLDVHPERGFQRIGFVTELVDGGAPRDRSDARRFLKQLTARFLEAGLPTWQVTPYNPRAVGNLIEQPDGTYRIIDLESNLVAPLMPLSGIVGAIRQGNFPSFDDIDLARLAGYVAREERRIVAALGAAAYGELLASVSMYRECVRAWRREEPRIISRSLRFALRLIDLPSWVRAARGAAASGQAASERLVTQGIDIWAAEGHISDARAATLREQARAPEVASALAHMGAHVAITVPLRFPLGSLARAGWTLLMRARAEFDALVRRRPAGSAREEHTLLVALFSLLPTFGAAAYMLAKPLRTNRAIAVIAFDRVLRKTPFRLYERLHLSPFMVLHARLEGRDGVRPAMRGVLRGVSQRLVLATGRGGPLAAVLTLNGAIVAAGGVLYFGYGTRVIFDEKGLMNTVDAIQLAAAGAFGIAAWRAFWASERPHALADAAGIGFWALAGVGLIYLAADDYFGLHEQLGSWLAAHSGTLPLTNTADDMITLGFGATGLVAVWIFRAELLALRPSSALLCGGVAAAAVMLVTDAFGHGFVRPLEFPAQMSACGLLLLANATRWSELRGRVAVADEEARLAEPVAA